jgi:hypothetical protein
LIYDGWRSRIAVPSPMVQPTRRSLGFDAQPTTEVRPMRAGEIADQPADPGGGYLRADHRSVSDGTSWDVSGWG